MSSEDFDYDTVPADESLQPIIEMLPKLAVNDLIRLYRDRRDELTAARKTYKQKEANEKDLMSRISMALRDIADKLGVDSFSTPDGTAYRNVKTKYRVANWAAIVEYIKETGNFQILERRIGKNAVREIHNETGTLPPGVDYVAETEFAVRKPSA